jgi:hypothetical protein
MGKITDANFEARGSSPSFWRLSNKKELKGNNGSVRVGKIKE